MSRPFPSLASYEGVFYAEMAACPLDPTPRLIFADWLEDQGQPLSADVLRLVEELRRRCNSQRFPRPDHLERLRGARLTEAACASIAKAIRALLADKKGPDSSAVSTVEAQLSAALGTPDAQAPLPNLRTPQGLRSQYDFHVTLLASLDLLEQDKEGNPGITGIDGQFHPLPSLDQIQQRLATPELRRKVDQGFDSLLLVPFALPIVRLIEAWKQHLLRNEHLLAAHGGLDRTLPVGTWRGYNLRNGQGPDADGRLVYFPQRLEQDHGGRTKADILAADPSSGWQALLFEGHLPDLLMRGRGQNVGSRPQIEGFRSPREYLDSLPTDEVGWTPETYIAAFHTHLERTGRPLDDVTFTYLFGSYLPVFSYVPDAAWSRRNRQVWLGGSHVNSASSKVVGRAAVRVV